MIFRGKCGACKMSLPSIELEQDEFQQLQQDFIERVMVGADVYYKTNPEEIAKFKRFVAKNAPFDIVLDALNIVNIVNRSGKNRSNHMKSKMVGIFCAYT